MQRRVCVASRGRRGIRKEKKGKRTAERHERIRTMRIMELLVIGSFLGATCGKEIETPMVMACELRTSRHQLDVTVLACNDSKAGNSSLDHLCASGKPSEGKSARYGQVSSNAQQHPPCYSNMHPVVIRKTIIQASGHHAKMKRNARFLSTAGESLHQPVYGRQLSTHDSIQGLRMDSTIRLRSKELPCFPTTSVISTRLTRSYLSQLHQHDVTHSSIPVVHDDPGRCQSPTPVKDHEQYLNVGTARASASMTTRPMESAMESAGPNPTQGSSISPTSGRWMPPLHAFSSPHLDIEANHLQYQHENDKTPDVVTLRLCWMEAIWLMLTSSFVSVLAYKAFTRPHQTDRPNDEMVKRPAVQSLLSSSLTTTLSLPPLPTPLLQRRISLQHQSSTNSDQGHTPSRFDNDFETIRYLGRGGFGKVFHVRNAFDGQPYAVKRIRLPTNSEDQRKVMREVKALAALDHQNIVRYYNAWMEDLPFDYPVAIASPDCAAEQSDFSIYGVSSGSADERFGPADKASAQSSTADSFTGSHSSTPLHNIGRHHCRKHMPRKPSLDHFTDDSTGIVFCSSTSARSRNSLNSSRGMHCSQLATIASSSEDEQQDSSMYGASSASDGGDGDLFMPGCSSASDAGLAPLKPNHDRHHQHAEQRQQQQQQSRMYLFIQMQLCREHDLKQWLCLCDNDRDIAVCMRIFYQVVSAVSYVHSRGLMHRDLKPSNVFFAVDGNVKVGDFGLATAFELPANARSEHDGSVVSGSVTDDNGWILTDDHHTGGVGTEVYQSPELASGSDYSQKVDIFSLGVIFFELLYPLTTAMERFKILRLVRAGDLPQDFTSSYPQEASLASQMLSTDQLHRPNARDIMKHSVLKNALLDDELVREKLVKILDSFPSVFSHEV
eukprot:scpid10054/ scgid1375/ Eukaryotic translation initiation factor 2-alpha kinase 3; PRKR-like endoplasmic reticulum kinase; Pancreatic eIF2-alpha kinase